MEKTKNPETQEVNPEYERIMTYKRTFHSPDGEKVIKDLMAHCNFIESDSPPENTWGMYYERGRRSVLMGILKLIDISVDRARELTQEATYGEEDEE